MQTDPHAENPGDQRKLSLVQCLQDLAPSFTKPSPLLLRSGEWLLFPVYPHACTLHFLNASVKDAHELILAAQPLLGLMLHGVPWQSEVQGLIGPVALAHLGDPQGNQKFHFVLPMQTHFYFYII